VLPVSGPALQAHAGEELAIIILPAAMLLGLWIFSAWPVKAKPPEDSNDGAKDEVTGGNS